MDITKLVNQLKIDEGKKLVVYKDSLGFLTVGVGHLVQKADHLKLGDKIPEEECDSYLAEDLEVTIKSCYKLFPDFDNIPEAAQQVIANMMFNLGYGGLSKFKKFILAIKNKNYVFAADSMKNSIWYGQVGERSKRLVNEMRKVK